MAKVTILNRREHDINLQLKDENHEVHSVTVPAAKKHPEDAGTLVPGKADVDSELLETLKPNEVVKSYFEMGWLSFNKGRGAQAQAQTPAQ